MPNALMELLLKAAMHKKRIIPQLPGEGPRPYADTPKRPAPPEPPKKKKAPTR